MNATLVASKHDQGVYRWQRPAHRDVGLFTNSSLYADTLVLALEHKLGVDEDIVRNELGPRLRGLAEKRPRIEDSEGNVSWVGLSRRVSSDLLRELQRFGWISRHPGDSKKIVKYIIAPEGIEALRVKQRSVNNFRHLISGKLHDQYQVPGWFVDRLWKINPIGQGEVLLPSPPKHWQPASWNWEATTWTPELINVCASSYSMAIATSKNGFPITIETWQAQVKKAWERLCLTTRKRKAVPTKDDEKIETFRPRLRLSMAMLEASIRILFDPVPLGSERSDIDVPSKRHYLVSARTLSLWCARLEELDLIFYTDSYRDFSGRFIFPVSVFRFPPAPNDFVRHETITSPDGRALFFHVPRWELHKQAFMSVIVDAHRRLSRLVGSLYVSLLDARDETCRGLRISASQFDDFLSLAFRESLSPTSQWSISIESDVREDQRSGHGQLRRPVWQDNVPYSLIAITRK